MSKTKLLSLEVRNFDRAWVARVPWVELRVAMFGRPQLLHRASTLVVVAKPSGWLVHPAGTDRPDVMAWLESQGLDGLVPVHRLDAETSGVTLFAPRSEAGRWGEAFATGQVEKRYLALVFGHPRAKGIVRRALSDGRRGYALEAVTRYRTLESFPRCALVAARPETGRKHQIRRHLQRIGHAVVGDARYRPRGKRTVPAFPGRLWLHAEALEIDGVRHVAPLPQELEDHLIVLRAKARDAGKPPADDVS